MNENKSVFITGGSGYCGSKLVPQLLNSGYKVTVYDIMYFGSDFLPQKDTNLTVIKGDIRDSELLYQSCKNHDYFVSLACISNDASFELDEQLSTSVNLKAFQPMVLAAKKAGIKRFIYASSSSVYGVSEAKDVTEDHPLVPLTLYNKYKGECEPILLENTDINFEGVIFRPATVCGYAPRLRLDLSVNILTNFAVNKNMIKVFGGEQLRPNLHVRDYCDSVQLLIESSSDLIKNQIFNIGYENLSIKDISLLVKKVVEKKFPNRSPIEIETTSSDDNRSYHINSDKIKKVLGYSPKYSVENAVEELCEAFIDGKIPNSFEDDKYFNVKKLIRLNVK
jgi:nucleoside-diphosphate-sugar epimerase